MATTGRTRRGKRRVARRKRAAARPARGEKATRGTAGSAASRIPAATAREVDAARRSFEEGVVSRGEAVPAGAPLPPGATHEIAGEGPDGRPRLRRRRFSLR